LVLKVEGTKVEILEERAALADNIFIVFIEGQADVKLIENRFRYSLNDDGRVLGTILSGDNGIGI